MLEEAHYYFQKAADVLNLPDRLREILLTPLRVVKVNLVFDDDAGQSPCKSDGPRRLLFICDPDGNTLTVSEVEL